METKKENRDNIIDIIKSIAIIMMVLGHSGFPFSDFIYLFHMAVFIIASGYLYKETTSETASNIICYIKNKIKHLWVPSFLMNTIFVVLNNFFIDIHIYTNDKRIFDYVNNSHTTVHSYMKINEILFNILKGVMFGGNTEIGGTFWFFRVLFGVSVSYAIFDYIFKKYKTDETLIQTIISFILLFIGYAYSIMNVHFHSLEIVFSCYILFHIGRMIKRFNISSIIHDYISICFIISFVVLLFLNSKGTISIGNNSYVNPLFFLLASMCGWIFLYSFSSLINTIKLKKVFLYIGKNTLCIMVLHFFCMKLVALFICKCYDLPLFCVAAFPNLRGNIGIWWLLYTFAGVSLPLLVNSIFKKMINYCNLT